MKIINIYGGKSPRDMAFYAVADAARVVRMPAATVRAWAFGRDYPTLDGARRWPALIKPADVRAKRLSFRNLVELHVLSSLRGRHVQVDRIRSATRWIRDEIGTDHPLADVDVKTDLVDIYAEFLGRLVNVSNPQQKLGPVVDQYLQRIGRDEDGLAQRLFPMTQTHATAPRLIVIDPARRFGRPVLTSANIETAIIAERFKAGESAFDLADDFGIEPIAVEEAVRFETLLRTAA